MDKITKQKVLAIENSLQDASNSLATLKQDLAGEAKKLPAEARHMEQRVKSLQDDVKSASGKMLAYKLHRLASSKMLESVSELAQEQFAAPAVKTNTSSTSNKKPSEPKVNAPAAAQGVGKYQSTTFQCKSDLDKCLVESTNALDKAVCYALFIRCAVKG